MTHFVTITSQGQVSIPVALRRRFAFDKTKQATMEVTDDGILIKPVPDILELRGVFKTKKKIPFKKIRKAFGAYLGRRHLQAQEI